MNRDVGAKLLAVIPSNDGIDIVEIDGVKNIHKAGIDDNEITYETPEGYISLSFSPDGGVEQKIQSMSGNTTMIKNYKGVKISNPPEN